MFNFIIETAVRFRSLIIFIVAAIATYGLFQLNKLPIDAVPDITNRQVQINTVAPALSPEQMERLVTYPIETALTGIPGLHYTRSLTRNGFAQVTVIFDDDVDIYFARQQVTERLRDVEDDLPVGVTPTLSPVSTGLGEVLIWTVDYVSPDSTTKQAGQPGWQPDGSYLTVEGARLTTAIERATYLRTVQDWIVAPQMRHTLGIADIDTLGGYVKEFVVSPYPEQLIAYGLNLSDIIRAIESANVQSGGGFIQNYGEAIVVRTDGLSRTLADLQRIPVTNYQGLVIHVSDVANVHIGQAPRLGAATRDGHEAVIGTALMTAGANSRTVAQAAAQRLSEVSRSLPPDIYVEPVLDRSVLVNATLKTVAKNLTEGALLVIVVLFLLLGNIRAAAITALVIPLSFLFAVIGMNRFGISGNLMSLGALDFGILVDGAVIVIEATLLMIGKKSAELGRPLTALERVTISMQAAKKMVRPAAFGQFIILLVFVPVLTLEGVEGKTFQPMAATFMLALLGAFIFSFTFIPAMTALFIREPKIKAQTTDDHAGKAIDDHETTITRAIRRVFEPVIRHAVHRPKIVFSFALLALVVGVTTFMSLGREFMPTLDEGDIALQALRVPSTSLEQSITMQKSLEKALKEVPEVRTIASRTGTAEAAMDPMPPNITDSLIMLRDRSEWPNPALAKQDLIERIEHIAHDQIGNAYEFSQPIELRFNELIAGVRTDLAVKIFGDDFTVLETVAQRVAERLQSIQGSADVSIEQISGLPVMTLKIDHTTAAMYGLTAAEVSDAITIGVGGLAAGQIFEGDRRFDIVVRYEDSIRNNFTDLAALPIVTASGQTIPLSTVASFHIAEGPNQISRENGSRRIVVQSNVRDRDLGSFITEAQTAVAQIQLPAGVYITWGGQFENLQRAEARLLTVIPVVFVLIGALLCMALGSWREASLVFVCVPLALVGGALALWLREMPFSVSAAVGFIAVSGVATLNGLVLMQAIHEKIAEGLAYTESAITGAASRLRAVFTTALVAIVGFIPMAIASGAGAEVQKPLATVVIGGLITATLLTLIVLPTFSIRVMKKTTAA